MRLSEIIGFIIDLVGSLGYFGIFFMMFLESSFFPFPSEVAMIPAGYLIYKGEMNIYGVLIAGITGSIAGALLNYYLGLKFGRSFIITYGKYFFFTQKSMKKMEDFFEKHGEISTFLARLLPALRQYISLPAGIAKMNLIKFCIYTTLGAGIWIIILIAFGYYIGAWLGMDTSTTEIIQTFSAKSLSANEINIQSYLHSIVLITLSFVAIIALGYILYKRRRK